MTLYHLHSDRALGSAEPALPTLGWIAWVGFGVAAVVMTIGLIFSDLVLVTTLAAYVLWAISAVIGGLAWRVDRTDRLGVLGFWANLAPWAYAVYWISDLGC